MAVVRAFRWELCGLLTGVRGTSTDLALALEPFSMALLMGPTPPDRGGCR